MSSSSGDVAGGLLAAGFGIFWVLYMIFIFAFVIFFLICEWKIFVKAGEPGWAAIIPFYNIWVLMKISCKNNVLWFILFLIGATSPVAAIISYIGLAKSFGKGTGMILLMIFVPVVAWPMLAFGKAEYDPSLKF